MELLKLIFYDYTQGRGVYDKLTRLYIGPVVLKKFKGVSRVIHRFQLLVMRSPIRRLIHRTTGPCGCFPTTERTTLVFGYDLQCLMVDGVVSGVMDS